MWSAGVGGNLGLGIAQRFEGYYEQSIFTRRDGTIGPGRGSSLSLWEVGSHPCGLLALETLFYLHTPPGRDPYDGFILPLMLLFSHLALAFKWPRPVMVALYILSFGWMIFGLFYDLYLSSVLYPVQIPGGN